MSSAEASEPAALDSAGAPEPTTSVRGVWARRLGVALLVVLLGGGLALALAWQVPLGRHRVLQVLTLLERRWSTGEAAPPGAVATTQHWIHAGWVGEGAPNSGPSVRAACASFRGVEVDVAFSQDLVPYLSHDGDYARISGVAGDHLTRHSAAEIDAQEGPEGEPAMRLAALPEVAACEVLVLDVKTDHSRAEAKAAALLEALGERRRGVWVLSMSGPFLQALGAAAPELLLGCEGYLPLGNALAGFHLSSLARGDVTSARDTSARERGLRRIYWTAHSEAELAELQAWGPEALLFDEPQVPAEALPAGIRLGERQ